MFACLFYYIHDEPMCHKHHTEHSDDFQQQIDCKFYREILLPFFLNAKAKIERGREGEIKTREIQVSKKKCPQTSQDSKFLSTIPVIIFWHFLVIQHRSEQSQVKRYLMSSITNLVHELPHEFPNDLRLRILGNWEILEKCQIWVQTQPSAQSSFQKLKFDNSCQKIHKIR